MYRWPFSIYMIILSIIWLLGFLLSYVMQRTEMAADSEAFTKGDRILIISLSLLSFIWVFVILITAWVKMVGRNGYWARPVTPAKETKLETEKYNA